MQVVYVIFKIWSNHIRNFRFLTYLSLVHTFNISGCPARTATFVEYLHESFSSSWRNISSLVEYTTTALFAIDVFYLCYVSHVVHVRVCLRR